MRANKTTPTEARLHFPAGGINVAAPFHRQPAVKLPNGTHARTTPVAENVRAFNPGGDGRARGGSRSGLSRWISTRGSGSTTWVVQGLNTVVGTGYTAPGGQTVQSSASGRIVNVVKVQVGKVYTAVPGATAWTSTTNASSNEPELNSSGIVQSAAHFGKLYFVDGTNYCYIDPADNTVRDFDASTAGSLPADSNGRRARLIWSWRGRLQMSAVPGSPHTIYSSATDDVHDWEDAASVAPGATGVLQTAGYIQSPQSQYGAPGDIVTCGIPYSNDVLIIGCNSRIYLQQGDPLAGGWLHLVTDSIGMLFGSPWCRLPDGRVIFFSNRGGVYSLFPTAGQVPTLLSEGISGELDAINTGTKTVHLQWNDREACVEIFITPTGTNAASTHYVLEVATNAFYRRTFANIGHNPLCSTVLDGNGPEDRVVLIGCRDGYVRVIDPEADTDDGVPIESRVLIGPILTPMMDELRVDQLQAVLGENDDEDEFDDPEVRACVLVGRTPEEALDETVPVGDTLEAVRERKRIEAGVLGPGLSPTFPVRAAGKAVYLELTSEKRWAMENVRLRIAPTGGVRRRGGGGE